MDLYLEQYQPAIMNRRQFLRIGASTVAVCECSISASICFKCSVHYLAFTLWIVLLLVSSALGAERQVSNLSARHEAGQTLLAFKELNSPVTQDTISVKQLRELRRELEAENKMRYRVYRSKQAITSIEHCEPIAELLPLTCWNADYYGIYPQPEHMALRYVVENGKAPVPPGTGIYAHNPKQTGVAYYAVTVVIDGKENTSVGAANSLRIPIHETRGQGAPVLQRVEKCGSFNYVKNPTLYYYVRWESPPNCAVAGKPYDYVVAVPANLKTPAPVGIHLHCWGASLNNGYGWWYKGDDGHILIASNQIPYDWWTGYHELYWQGEPDKETWKRGVVRPYSQIRMFSFLDWVATQWKVDLTRTHVAGNSMGGSGSPMLAIRFPDRIAWATAWVGVHIPSQTPQFKGSYEQVYGQHAWDVSFEDGTSVWDHFSDAWYLKNNPRKEIGLICFSNGKNDSAIGWPQAVEFLQALQDTRRPHVFVWGQGGHGQRARLPISLSDRDMPMDLRIDQSLPAFTACSLDDDPGHGDPKDGDSEGQINLYLYWDTNDIVDQAASWGMTVGLVAKAPQNKCTVNITPRRLQRLKPQPGQKFQWSNTSLSDNSKIQTGQVTADEYGLITLEKIVVTKGKNRISIER
jgi:pimeloyl-ACP methyl ester carboxylesterase